MGKRVHQRECGPADTWILARETDFRLPTSRTVGEQVCVILSHQVCGSLLQLPNDPSLCRHPIPQKRART